MRASGAIVAGRWGTAHRVAGRLTGEAEGWRHWAWRVNSLVRMDVGFSTFAWLIVTRRLSEDTVSKGRFAVTFQLGSSGTFLPVEGIGHTDDRCYLRGRLVRLPGR